MYKALFIDDENENEVELDTDSLETISSMSRSWFGSVGKFNGAFITVQDSEGFEVTIYEETSVEELTKLFRSD
jgi:hypothetical protein